MRRVRSLLVLLALCAGAIAVALAMTGGVVWLDLYARPAVKAWLGGR